MKKRLRFFALMLVSLLATGLWAQTWTASPVGEGEFYLYSVSEGKFLTAGTSWSTRASLTTQGGIPLTFSAVNLADGIYSISSAPTYNNLYMGVGSDGNEAYFDVSATSSSQSTNWKIIPVEGEENTYLIQAVKNSKYMVAHASKLDRTSVTSTAVPTTSKGYWKFVTKEALIANLANATEDNPIDVTFAVMNPFFGAAAKTTLWTGDYTAYDGVNDNKCIEQYNRTFDMYQTITGLPNGIYKMQCQGFYRMGGRTAAKDARNGGTEALNAKYYINTTEGSLMSIFDGTMTTSYTDGYNENTAYAIDGVNHYIPNSLKQASNCFLKGDYQNGAIKAVVTDGTVKLGFRKTATVGSDWTAYDNVTLTYYGVDLSALVESYESLLATAKSLQSEPMQASVKTDLNAAVSAAETNVNTGSQSWLETTISTLSTAITAAQASNALYTGAILTSVNGMKAQSTSESVKTAVQAKYDAGEYATAADVYATYQPLEIAALGTAANTDFTSAIINPGFELGSLDGWTIKTMGKDTRICTPTSSLTYSHRDGYFFNTWTNAVTTLDINQTITGLPNGSYTISAVVAGYADGSPITLTANGKSEDLAPAIAETEGYTVKVENVEVGDGTLTFSVSNTGKGNTFFKADDFRLTFNNSLALDNYTDLALTVNLENEEVANYLANTTYDESTASVITNYNTAAQLRNDQPATISIPLPAQSTDATLYVGLSSTYDGAQTFTVAAGSERYHVANLYPQQTYYYKVEAGGAVVANGTIKTTGRLRMIKADGISNMRDLGGWTNADGNRIKYGKIYRGSELKAGKTYTATDADLAMLKDELGIGAEVDLREDIDFASGTMSTSAIDGATYYYANLSVWGEDALNFQTAKFKSAFDLVLAALKADKAAYFHCIFGADRTGCFAMLLEGLLGLPVDQLYKDYELTSFSSAGARAKEGIDHKIQYIKALQGDNLQQKFYNYWRGAVGVSESDLNDFINIMVDGTSPITTATLAALPAKLVEDGNYYIYLPTENKFLGRGRRYGAQGVADNYGVPATITTNGANVTTIKYMDSNLFFGSDGFTDKVASYNTASCFVEEYQGNLVLKSHKGGYFYMKTDDGDSRAYGDATTAAEATPIALKTAAEQRAIVAAAQEANILAAAAAAGIEATDLSTFNAQLAANYTAVKTTADIKSANAGSDANWPLTQPTDITNTTDNYGNAYNVGNYGGELYQRHGYVSQTVNVPHAGLYKLTLNALYRQGSNDNCYALGQKGYELSNAYVSINGEYFAQVPSWYSDCAGNANPNTTEQAKALIDAGKYAIELYAYIGDEKKATIAVNVPGFTPWGWCLFNNFALTEYAKKVTLDETSATAPEAYDFAEVTLNRTITEGFNTICLPFDLTADQVSNAFGNVQVYTLTGETLAGDGTYTLNFAEGTAITANTPAIIKGVASEKAGSSYTFTGVTITPETAPASSTENFDFIGTYTPITVPEGCYFLKKGSSEIKESTGITAMKGFRAYIAPKNPEAVKAFSLTFEDIETGIEEVNNESVNSEKLGSVYNLAGQRLSKPQKGINIVNGKKVIIK